MIRLAITAAIAACVAAAPLRHNRDLTRADDLAKWGKKMWGWGGLEPVAAMYEPSIGARAVVNAVPDFESKWIDYRCQILTDMFRDASVISAIEASPTTAKPGNVESATSKLIDNCIRSAMGISSLAPLCAVTAERTFPGVKISEYRCAELCKGMVNKFAENNGLSVIKTALGAGENKSRKTTDAMSKVVNVKSYVPPPMLLEALFAHVAKDGVAAPNRKTNACNPTAEDVKKYF